MAGFKTIVATVLISAVSAASAFAFADEPAAFQAQFPNRDVLNGGALTPAGRLGLELPSGASIGRAADNPDAGTGSDSPSHRIRRHHARGRH